MQNFDEEIVYLTVQDVVLIHDMSVRQWGGRKGILNFAMLDSAVNRVRTAMAYESEPDAIKAACLYAHAIGRNHGFRDGNKRTAYGAMSTCLAVNGLRISGVEDEEMAQRIVDLATGATPVEEFEIFIRDVVTFDDTFRYIQEIDLGVEQGPDPEAEDAPAP
jgi:death-on-curing protein